ncbi:hypothetical protein M422DRAFT_222622 [Sphaerobolus stellatus SS14]|nr:hypothetical protein M422DRAFT_222622 [Sphaerobolus stellatus SS14]
MDSKGSHEEKNARTSKTSLQFEQLGVWTVMEEVNHDNLWIRFQWNPRDWIKEIIRASSILYRFALDCYAVSPWRMSIYIIFEVWSSLTTSLDMYFTGKVLNAMQNGLSTGSLDGRILFQVIMLRISLRCIQSSLYRINQSVEKGLSTRVRNLFEKRLLSSNLRLDLSSCEEKDTFEKYNKYLRGTYSSNAWKTFDGIIGRLRVFINTISQLTFLFGVLGSHPGGFWFSLICLINVFSTVGWQSRFYKNCPTYAWDSNPNFRRLRAVLQIATDLKHRMEIISDGISNYLEKEWSTASENLVDVSYDPIFMLRAEKPLTYRIVQRLIGDLPLMFYTFQVYLSPKAFSLSAIALTQQASQSLSGTFSTILNPRGSLSELVQAAEELYTLQNPLLTMTDGTLDHAECAPKANGMDIIFKHVYFSYPKETENVIRDVSFTIKQGQIVVIVGLNGSGKSTLFKLINRLYDVKSGTVFVDGHSISSYMTKSLRNAMAMHYQTYTHYPLSIYENILLGNADDDSINTENEQALRDSVKEAIEMGGAEEVLEKQPAGMDSVLKPNIRTSNNKTEAAGPEFKAKMAEIGKTTELSAGQWQRLALARLFYRAKSKRVRLVAVDEPSASLDPKMEYSLFERLRALSSIQGKTLIYVTHRFGYLTKRADLILVMREGQLVEQGRHSDLLKLDGEYANLYKLQAEAFMSDVRNYRIIPYCSHTVLSRSRNNLPRDRMILLSAYR